MFLDLAFLTLLRVHNVYIQEKIPCCLWLFVVPQLPSLLPSVFGWPDHAVTWLGQKAMRKLTPEEKVCCSLLVPLCCLKNPDLKWMPAARRKEDMSNMWGRWWAEGLLILVMVCLRYDIRLCSKATWVHTCCLLTSEEDLAITGNI